MDPDVITLLIFVFSSQAISDIQRSPAISCSFLRTTSLVAVRRVRGQQQPGKIFSKRPWLTAILLEAAVHSAADMVANHLLQDLEEASPRDNISWQSIHVSSDKSVLITAVEQLRSRA